MAIRQVRIGGNPNIVQYDDADFPNALETDHTIKVGTAPTINDEVLRYQDMPVPGSGVGAAANITDHAIVRGEGGAKAVQDSLATIDDTGSQNIPTGQGYKVNAIQVVTDQQLPEADAVAISAIVVSAGADTIDIAATNNDLITLVTEINNLKTKINNLLTKLRTHGLIDT